MITYSINAHPAIALMFSQTGTDVLPRRDEGSDKPSATIEPHRIMVPTRTRTQTAGLKVRCRYHYTTAAHIIVMGCHFCPTFSIFWEAVVVCQFGNTQNSCKKYDFSELFTNYVHLNSNFALLLAPLWCISTSNLGSRPPLLNVPLLFYFLSARAKNDQTDGRFLAEKNIITPGGVFRISKKRGA